VLQYVEGLGLSPGRGRALDFGCGPGRLTQALADRFEEVVGIDISGPMIEEAKRRNTRGSRVRFIVNLADNLEIIDAGTVDFIFTTITLQHSPRPHMDNYIAEFVRILAPGGVAVFDAPNDRLGPRALRVKVVSLRRHIRRVWRKLCRRAAVEIHHISKERVIEIVEDAGGGLRDALMLPDRAGRAGAYRYCVTRNGTATG
jgi:ubiquinone/menaquinone biosynthesis C-methylase UbiE